ncbi:hypothetical protein EMIT0P218_150084 [Pseudomonas sp. IT-P218]
MLTARHHGWDVTDKSLAGLGGPNWRLEQTETPPSQNVLNCLISIDSQTHFTCFFPTLQILNLSPC